MSGAELSHKEAPFRDGNTPSIGGTEDGALLIIIIMVLPPAIALPPDMAPPLGEPVMAMLIDPPAALEFGVIVRTSDCSRLLVLAYDNWVSTPLSQPRAMATTPSNMATPRPRRIHSPAPRDRFISLNRRPPASMVTASDTAAPAA